MDVFSICVVSVVAIVFLGLWLDVRSRDRAEKARSEQDEKLNAVKKTLDGTQQHMNSPFGNGAKELKEMYMRIYGFDYQKANCAQADFD